MMDPLFQLRIQSILQGRGIYNADAFIDYIIVRDVIGNFTIQFWNVAKLGTQPDDSQISAISDAQANATINVAAQKNAQAIIDAMPIFEKAIILAIIDQLNVIRSKLSPPLGAITSTQAIQAVRDKAGTLS